MGFWAKHFGRSGEDDAAALRERLATFRHLVDENNRVLELIADAGEKLGGEYVFDHQYLRSLAQQLEAAVRDVTYDLSRLSGNRYPELTAAFEKTRAAVRATLESTAVVPEADLVIPIAEVDDDLADAVGAKMARLGQIRKRLGCRIPDGIVISTTACHRLLETAGVLQQVERMEPDALGDRDLEEISARLVQAVLAAVLPKDLQLALRAGLSVHIGRAQSTLLAVRSSAVGEDGDFSFAGQYETLLGVPPAEVESAYKKVVASFYAPHVMRYRKSLGLHPARGTIAVGCFSMVRARAAGVVYTVDPTRPDEEILVIGATRGLGKVVVDGSESADRYEVARRPPHEVVRHVCAAQETMLVTAPTGGTEWAPVTDDGPPLTDAMIEQLARTALQIETFMKCAQDVEWAVDAGGELVLLQARPLRIESSDRAVSLDLTEALRNYDVLLSQTGAIACRGIASGPVHLLEDVDRLGAVPAGAVVVARAATPRLAAVLSTASAVITDVGSPTGHLAAVARDFRVPTIVDTGNATRVLADAGEVTVDAEENVVYDGRVEPLLRYQILRSSTFEETPEFRTLRGMLRRIAPLRLKDPQAMSFTAKNCRTYHDIIRFAHEKAIAELTEGYRLRPSRRNEHVRRLELEVPLDLVLLDLGGGLDAPPLTPTVKREHVRSAPLVALLEGLVSEAWSTGPADMDLNGFLSSAMRVMPILGMVTSKPEQNLAVISGEYLNLSLRLGYHFTIVDCYLTDTHTDNYVYFRFAGGATELARRSRRAGLLKRILEQYDFVVEAKGDLVIGRVKELSREATVERLHVAGKLVGFTRQLDVFLRDDNLVDRCFDRFMGGEYDVFE